MDRIIAALVMLAIASSAFGIGAKLLVDAMAFRRKSVAVRGRYLGDKETRRRGDGPWLHAYQVEASFHCPFLKTKRLTRADVASTVRSSRMVGDHILILVSSEPPHQAKVGTLSNLFLAPVALLAVGAPATFLLAAYIAGQLS